MSAKHLSAEAFHKLHKFHKECSVCQRLAANDQPGLIQEVLLARKELESLRAENAAFKRVLRRIRGSVTLYYDDGQENA